MSGRAVALSAIVLVAAALVFGAPVRANDAAHKMAEKFAEADGADAKKKEEERKAAETKKQEADKVAAEKKREAHRKAEAARKALEAKRRAAAKAAEDARRAAERRQADEAEMLARARREAEEMRAAEEEVRLTEEARRLIIEAEAERAKAEELLANQPDGQRARVAVEPESEKSVEEARLAYQRAEETRHLAEKLRRVRQIREARLAAQAARREADAAQVAAGPTATAPVPSENAPPPAAAEQLPIPPQVNAPTSTAGAIPPPAMAAALPTAPAPPTQAVAPPPAPAKSEAVAAAPASVAPPTVAPAPPKPPDESVARRESAPKAAVAEDRGDHVPATQPVGTAMPAAGVGPTRFTVLVVLEPGTYGIRRNGPKVADPVLCTHDGCYVSGGADRPAAYMPGHKALGIGNTWGGRAGACRQALGCVFRGVELGQLPGFLQPVDLHIFKHDRRQGHLVLADSNCRADAGRLSCRHGIYADNYTMWVIPESLAATVGPAALQRAVTEGLNGPRSAELAPMQR